MLSDLSKKKELALDAKFMKGIKGNFIHRVLICISSILQMQKSIKSFP